MPPIAYKLHPLNDLPEIALVKTVHVAQKTSVSILHGFDKKNEVFGFGSGTVTALVHNDSE